MVPLSIRGMPAEGNPSAPLCAVSGSWTSAGGLHLRCGVRAGRPGRAASTLSRPWSAPCLSHCVPYSAVLTPAWLFRRPPLLACCAALSARRHAVRGGHSRATSARKRKEVTMRALG